MSRSLPTVLALLLLSSSCVRTAADEAPAPAAQEEPVGGATFLRPSLVPALLGSGAPEGTGPGGVAATDPAPGGTALTGGPSETDGDDEIPAFLREDAPDLPVAVDLDDRHLEAWVEGFAHGEREPTLEELMARVTVSGRDGDGGEEDGGDEVGGSGPHRGDRPQAPADPSLRELMASVVLEDGESEESWAYLDGAVPHLPADALDGEAETGSEGALPTREATDGAPAQAASEETTAPSVTGAEDPCEPLRRALAHHRDYLLRVGAERDTYGYVENTADSNALRLLQGLRRCGSNPDDADCKAPPIEMDVSALEVPAHQIFRDPSDLLAEGRDPDEIPHDRVSVDLVHKLQACERSQIAQPLLQRGK